MKWSELTPGGLYIMRQRDNRDREPQLTIVRISESRRLWRWDGERAYVVVKDAKRPARTKGIGHLAVRPPMSWPASAGTGAMLRRSVQRWARPLIVMRSPLPDPAEERKVWHDVPTYEEELQWCLYDPKDIVCPHIWPHEFEKRILDRLAALGVEGHAAQFPPLPQDQPEHTDLHRASLPLDIFAELLDRIPESSRDAGASP
ncbi:hypothetical protein [Streptomyces sp. NBC_01481]|uniref:hypothetical protein n=1 Tax=Streptomyces sp. NBC_01481 TaxID=2975869 RepID=UPI0022532ADD|nr:hypothetical protein [Streptomyces sp. NBC_01481]MCX4586309.1 hypothetical protein [Streptomyces sp. NBC_01481]